MGGIRPSKANAPWVGTDAVGATTFLGLTDTPATYVGQAGKVCIVNPGETALEFVNPGGFVASNVVEGQAIRDTTLTDGTNEIESGVRGFHDDFTAATLKPFWLATQAYKGGYLTLDAVNDRLTGTSSFARPIREGIEGDYDYSIKVTALNDGSSGCYFRSYISGYGSQASIAYVPVAAPGGQIQWTVGGSSGTVSAPVTIGDPLWLRIRRRGSVCSVWWKALDNDPWILLNSSTLLLGSHVLLDLSFEDNDTYCTEVRFWDNKFPGQVRSSMESCANLTDAASIVIDASIANIFDVTLTADRQLANPTNPVDGQRITIRVRQDVTGGWVLTYDTKYRFSTDLPSPTLSTDPSALDYLGFIYNLTDDKWDYVAQVFGF